MRNRIDALRGLMSERSIDALLVTSEINVHYLTGFTGDSSYLLVSEDRAAILSDRRYEIQIASECSAIEAFIRGPDRQMLQVVEEAVGAFGCAAVGLESAHTSWNLVQSLQEAMGKVEFIATQNLVESLRQIKDPGELEIIRQAIAIAERTFGAIRATLSGDQCELEIAYQIEHWIRHFGGTGCGFDSIVAVGCNAALPHAQPGSRQIQDDPVLLLDWGAKFQGYTSDLTRMTCVGAPAGRFAEIYPIVLDAQLAAIEAIRPGATFRDVDAAARDLITRAGYGDNFNHGLGHGIGLEIHESPRMASSIDGELRKGMIVTVEPGIYLPGEVGVRIEDDILVTSGGHEVLSSLPKGLADCTIML